VTSEELAPMLKTWLAEILRVADDPVAVMNELREFLALHSPMKDQPVDTVLWVPMEQVRANDYNPNAVAKNELRLLHVSIDHDGLTQPIVTVYDEDADQYVIVDGFHRYYLIKTSAELQERTFYRVPIVVIDKPINDRMASTVRHNRARGKHSVTGMGNMVFDLLDNGWKDAAICDELGMEPDELLRLKHITGFSKLFENVEYRRAWETRRQIKYRKEYLESVEYAPSFLIVSTADRASRCVELLNSIRSHRLYADSPVYVVTQGYDDDQQKRVDALATDAIHSNTRLGPHVARVMALEEWSADAWINLDDDMLLTEWTDYTLAVRKAMRPGVGFVSGNWARTAAMAADKAPKRQDEFKRQHIVYTAGGLVYSDSTARLILENLPHDVSMHFDDVEWSLTAYVNGLENFRFLGSIAVHAVVGAGGRKPWIKDTLQDERPLPPEDLIATPPGKTGWKIPGSAHLTQEAHDRHKRAKESSGSHTGQGAGQDGSGGSAAGGDKAVLAQPAS
jgi:hypothetical protein